ncbi:MAG TPA: ParB/RepB/Spo0J family partition protein [Candidatus Saccharimonadales bacterium]|nr:ParB/RepB/Spo0J family partition protein [Candidatus Saccharimonadales bacterium]
MSTAVRINHEYRNLPLAQLQESPTNPRRRFDEQSLAELAASFAVQGVLQPLLVRSIDDEKYEVVAGARRLRAAKLAALEEVPARIVALSDIEVLECQLIENGQREGVHPMEEASAYRAMIEADGAHYDVARIAATIGRTQTYVATRLRLAELIPSIAEAFLADQIGVGHALEIAKLPSSEQQRAFDAAFRAVWNGSKESRVVLPVRELTAWIEQNILLSLEGVPFDKNDEALFPEAGSCTNCPKRTGYNTLLFGSAISDSCTDGNCYNTKIAKCVEKQIAEKPKLVQVTTAWGARGNDAVLGRNRYVALNLSVKNGKPKAPLSPNQKPCKSMSEAIVVDGTERGHTVKVCADPNCPIHFPDRQTPKPEQIAKEREQRRKELEKQKLETTIRHRILAEVLKRIAAPLDRADLVLVATTLLNRLEPTRRELLARRHKLIETASQQVTYQQVQQAIAKMLKQTDEAALSKLLIEIALLEVADQSANGESDLLTTTAKRHRVDVEKIRKSVEQDFLAKRSKQETKQKEAGKKSAAKKAA